MLFNRPRSRFFRPEHVLLAKAFYEKHGGKAIILARFMPLVRTFVPVVAGVAQMRYRRFATFNVVGGAAWVLSMTLIGFALGNSIPHLERHIEKVIVVVVVLSLLPGLFEYLKARRRRAAPADVADAVQAPYPSPYQTGSYGQATSPSGGSGYRKRAPAPFRRTCAAPSRPTR